MCAVLKDVVLTQRASASHKPGPSCAFVFIKVILDRIRQQGISSLHDFLAQNSQDFPALLHPRHIGPISIEDEWWDRQPMLGAISKNLKE